MKSRKNISILLFSLISSACTVGPDYVKPEITTPQQWSTETTVVQNTDTETLVTWWKQFNDPILDELITATAENNLDVKIATTRLLQARAARKSARAQQLPTINNSNQFRKRQISQETASAEAGLNQAGLINRQTNQYDLAFDTSFEIDIFGGTRRRLQSAEANIAAADLGISEVRTTVLAEVGSAYWQLRGAQYQHQVIQSNLETQQKSLEVIEKNRLNGLATEFDVQRLQTQVAATESLLPGVEATITSNIYAIALLSGEQVNYWQTKLITYNGFTKIRDSVPVGMPADILRRRPDIRRMEQQLQKANADIGVAVADLYPKFFLSGIGALQSENTGDLFSTTAFAFSVGPTISLPIFQGGRIRANINDKEAIYERTLLEYEQSILTALNEVETHLVRYDKQLAVVASLEKAVTASRQAAELARQLYEDGLGQLIELLDAERELRNIEADYVRQQTSAVVIRIALFKSLGGGWDA